MIIRSIVAATLLLGTASGVLAQSAPMCDGSFATIRTSGIMPGNMPLFEKAVKDQAAWYATHPGGSTSYLLKVFHFDAKTNAASYATDEAMTITTHKTMTGEPTHDAGWTAFVSEFKSSSTIKDEHRVCLPRM